MTHEQARKYRNNAEQKQQSGDYLTAGHYCSHAGFEIVTLGTPIRVSTGHALRDLLNACICYRIEGADQWCENRVRMGLLLAEELGTRFRSKPPATHPFDRAQRGVWDEFIGDFRVIGRLGGSERVYERAKETYREAGDPHTGSEEPPHATVIWFFYSVADAAGADMDEVFEATHNQPFSEWVEYKQERLPGLLETVVENGSYPL